MGKKAGGRRQPGFAPGKLAQGSAAEGLGRVQQQYHAAAVAQGFQRIPGGFQTEQRHRQNRPGTGSDGPGHLGGVHQPGLGIDIDKHRLGPTAHDGLRRGGEGIHRCDDLVALVDVHGLHHQHQGIGARGHRHRRRCAGKGRGFFFEQRHLGAENILPAEQHPAQCLPHVVGHVPVLFRGSEKRYPCSTHSHLLFSRCEATALPPAW